MLHKGILGWRSASVRMCSAYCVVTEIVCCFGPVSGSIILNKSQMNVGGERRKITSNKEGYYQLNSQRWSYGAEKWKQKRSSLFFSFLFFLFFKMENLSRRICLDESLVHFLNLQRAGVGAAVPWSTQREAGSTNKPPKLERVVRFLVLFGQRDL